MIVSLKHATMQLSILFYSPEPNGEELQYTIRITIDGIPFAELGGTECDDCFFDVSVYHSYSNYAYIYHFDTLDQRKRTVDKSHIAYLSV